MAKVATKVIEISKLNFLEKRGRKSWLIPMIKDLEPQKAIAIGRKLEGQELRTTRSNLSNYGRKKGRQFSLKADAKGDLYVMRLA
jgi:hypothetical protein